MYEFATRGIDHAVSLARAAAGDRDVAVMGGAHTIRQFLAADLVDEIGLHLVPVLLGSGTRLFEDAQTEHRWLEALGVVPTDSALHLRYRVAR